MKIKEVTSFLESFAPLQTQESYDNCGLIVGDSSSELKGVLVTLDCIEETVEEAIANGCNLIIAHHPIVFKGLKKINGKNYVERTILKAIKNDVSIYAIHTNFDNYRLGVNREIAERLNLENIQILSPKNGTLVKLVCFVPKSHSNSVKEALFSAGAGHIGDYSECSFTAEGTGTFKPMDGSNPFSGSIGEREAASEDKLEVILSNYQINKVLGALKDAHPYEEVAYDLIPLLNENQFEGSGVIGTLNEEVDEVDFLTTIKAEFKCGIIRHTALQNKKIKRVALCGGSGSFLLNAAKQKKADIFITADFKYHEFFDAESQILIADIGHYESEQYTSHRLARILKEKFTNFAVRLTEVNTNPINYF